MQSTPYTSHQYFKTLKLVFMMLMLGSALFPALVYLMTTTEQDETGPLPNEAEENMPMLIGITVGFAFIIIGSFIVKQMLVGKAREEKEIGPKATKYRSALLVQYALLEGSSIFIAVMSMVAETPVLALLCVIPLVLLFLNRPGVVRMAQQLHLTPQEAAALSKPDFVISHTRYNTES